MLAQKHHLMVYVTALNGNDMNVATGSLRTYFSNLVSNTNGELDRFKKNALLPLLTLMNKYKDSKLPGPDSNLPVIYAFDLMNEIEAALTSGYFSNFPNPWVGARLWIQNMAAYVKLKTTIPPEMTSWLPVTSSAGGSYAGLEIIIGLFSGLRLDFYDLHAYADWGLYPGLTALCSRVPIILGEYGQTSQTTDDILQYWTTANFIYGAKTHCFSAALAWKYETSSETSGALSQPFTYLVLPKYCSYYPYPPGPPRPSCDVYPQLSGPPYFLCPSQTCQYPYVRPAYSVIQFFGTQ